MKQQTKYRMKLIYDIITEHDKNCTISINCINYNSVWSISEQLKTLPNYRLEQILEEISNTKIAEENRVFTTSL